MHAFETPGPLGIMPVVKMDEAGRDPNLADYLELPTLYAVACSRFAMVKSMTPRVHEEMEGRPRASADTAVRPRKNGGAP